MRKATRQTLVTAAALLGMLGSSGTASAISIDLEWSGSESNLTTADWQGSATLILDVYATFTVPPGLNGLTVSVSFDPAALSLASCALNYEEPDGQLVAGAHFNPLLGSDGHCYPRESDTVGGLDQQVWPPLSGYMPYLPGPGSVHIAQMQFHVKGVVFGNTVVQSFFNPILDGWGDNNLGFSLNAAFGSATARLVPEPATAVLVGCGLLGLIVAARRGPRG